MGTKKVRNIGGKDLTPEQISAEFIRNQIDIASEKLGEKVTKAVITVPAYFNQEQREATINAAKIVGVEVVRIINEPTSAAIAYGLDKKAEGKKTVLVYDLGGGTYDCSIITIDDGVFEVVSTAGINNLGGDDYDNEIFKIIAGKIKEETGKNISKDDKRVYHAVLEASQKAKHDLSSSFETIVSLPFLFGPESLQYTITRAQFEDATRNLTLKTISKVREVLKDAKLSSNEIDQILLVGGSTRMPMVSEMIEKEFNKKPSKELNPDEVVAIGASIQGAVMAGDIKDVLLLDVTPLSLGIVTEGANNTILIPRNSTIPTSKKQIFSTSADNQPSVDIQVLQGERPYAFDNKIIGNFQLDGIPAAPRGVPQVEVTFSIDANGVVSVSAKELKSNKENSITISNSQGLSEEEIQRMIREAEENKEKDDELRENIETLNKAQNYIYMFEKQIEEIKSKPDFNDQSEEFKNFTEKYESFKKSVEAKDYSKIKEELANIEKLSEMYDNLAKNQPQPQGDGSSESSSSNSGEDEVEIS